MRFVVVLLALVSFAGPVASEGRRKVVTTSSLVVYEPIQFVPGTAQIDPRSTKMLDALAASFIANTDLLTIEVRAYGADVRRDQHQLGRLRARAIVDALVARKVERPRLVPRGMARPPVGTGSGPAFYIITRASSAVRTPFEL